MTPTSAPRATVTRTAFRLSCSVSTLVDAPAETVWTLLTDTDRIPAWNSTVTSIDGRVAAGERLRVRVPYSSRTFPVTVTELAAPHAMTWSDGALPMFRGVRTFSLAPTPDGSTRFTMTEVFRGLLLPLIARTLPDLGAVFEQYADDLAAEAARVRPQPSRSDDGGSHA